jgi:hypothetical protein
MQTRPQTQSTFAIPDKPHRLVASDRVEGIQVRRSDRTKVGSIERLMIDKASGKVAYAVLTFGGFMGVGAKHIPVPDEIQRCARRLRDQPERRRVVARSAF